MHSEAIGLTGRAPACQLVVHEGANVGRAVTLSGSVVVGSGRHCTLVLDDDRVSERHVEIVVDGAGFVVRDLGSTNGTLFEGSLIKEARVGVGATIKVGRSFLRIQPRAEPLDLAPSQARRFGELVAESLAMREVFTVLEMCAQSDVTVLLEGDTGTGKELAARSIHEASARRRAPFVAVDCGALPESLLESELFGHVRGAFTGAANAREGAFARADHGTLFLDELGAVSASVQARLLRAIEERVVRPVGSDKERTLDVRLVAASRHDLETRVAEGTFRADLFYRLSVVRVTLPPLKNRREDLPLLVAEIMRRRGIAAGIVAGANLDRLTAHAWPGNVRELRNTIDRAIALSPSATSFEELRIRVDAAPVEEPLLVRSDLSFADAKQAVIDAFEQRYLRDAFAREGGNVSALSRACGLDRKHLGTLLRRYGIVRDT